MFTAGLSPQQGQEGRTKMAVLTSQISNVSDAGNLGSLKVCKGKSRSHFTTGSPETFTDGYATVPTSSSSEGVSNNRALHGN